MNSSVKSVQIVQLFGQNIRFFGQKSDPNGHKKGVKWANISKIQDLSIFTLNIHATFHVK